MGIGLGIFLILVGAILKFATHLTVSGFDLQNIGLICMLAGALSLLVGFLMMRQRTHVRTEALVEHRETGLPRDPRDPRV